MKIDFDGNKTLVIEGKEFDVNEIYAFDIAHINNYNHLRLIKKTQEIDVFSSEDPDECIDKLMILKSQLRDLKCEQFALIDYVIVNMDKINNVCEGKRRILVEFDDRSFTKEVDIASRAAFVKTFDRYLASNMSNLRK